MLHQIKAQQFYTDLGLQKIVKFKHFSRLFSDFPVLFKADLIFNDFSRKPSKFKYFSRLFIDFPVLFKADLIFNDFSRKPSKFKYFSSLCKPWRWPKKKCGHVNWPSQHDHSCWLGCKASNQTKKQNITNTEPTLATLSVSATLAISSMSRFVFVFKPSKISPSLSWEIFYNKIHNRYC